MRVVPLLSTPSRGRYVGGSGDDLPRFSLHLLCRRQAAPCGPSSRHVARLSPPLDLSTPSPAPLCASCLLGRSGSSPARGGSACGGSSSGGSGPTRLSSAPLRRRLCWSAPPGPVLATLGLTCPVNVGGPTRECELPARQHGIASARSGIAAVATCPPRLAWLAPPTGGGSPARPALGRPSPRVAATVLFPPHIDGQSSSSDP
jgi:hypothetical protein